VDYGCIIGNRVKIHCNVYIAQFTVIEDDVFIAPGVSITNDLHPLCSRCMKGPTLRRGVRIGAGAVILPRIEIGENSLVGAGAVVTRSIPPDSVVAGNPARVIKSVGDIKCSAGLGITPYPNI
jgi:acetyltransferase-like isoleucine patch superfamily enzyme